MKARVQYLNIPADRRIIAVSDVHGNLPWLKGLLKQVGFGGEDVLVLVGDLLEKGRGGLALLRYVMDLSQGFQVHAVTGNCDTICLDLASGSLWSQEGLLDYLAAHPESTLHEFGAEAGLTLRNRADLARLRAALNTQFRRECDFLRSLPTILETEHFVFVHGGVPSYEAMEELDAWSCMKNDDFMGQGHTFPKYCVVGHWPVTLYHENIPCCNPLIDRTRKIASIDGGCSLKVGGQLNALVLLGPETFETAAYDDYPVMVAQTDQAESQNPATIRWVDHDVEILERGGEFSKVRHLATGRTLWVLTRYLQEQGGRPWCCDFTDYRLGVRAGELLSVVEETSRGSLVKKSGVLGWYLGELKTIEKTEKSR